jgi:outer membrane biosynthesis protein TonB
MSQSPFLTETAAAVADEPVKDGRRTVVMVGALGAVLMAAGAFYFLGGSDEADDDLGAVTRAPRAQAPAPEPEQALILPAAADVQLGRNPFRALYVQPAPEPAAVAPAPKAPPAPPPPAPPQIIVVNNPPPPPAPAPVAPRPVAPAPAPPAPAPAAPAPAPVAPAPAAPAPPAPAPAPVQSTVRLVSVTVSEGSPPCGKFLFDNKEYEGAKGAIIDGKLLVVDLVQNDDGGWYAVLQVGDGSPFEVHKNQEVIVQ